jgi:putative oxidoreductase
MIQEPEMTMNTKYAEYAPLPLRLVLGFAFLDHGFPKFGAAHEMTTGMFQGVGIPAPGTMVYLVGLVEVVGGIALILGAFVALASVPLIITMLVAMFTVHLPNGFSFIHVTGMNPQGMPTFGMPGAEVNLLYIAGLLALALMGAGALSVEAMRGGTRRVHAA